MIRSRALAALMVLPALAVAKAKVVVRATQPAAAVPAVVPAPRPASPEASTVLWLPFDGTWAVQRGAKGKEGADHPALRFQKVDAQGSPRNPKAGARAGNAAYYSWSAVVYAPFEGDVVEVENGIRDNDEPGDLNRKKPLGNHVLLRHPDGDYTLLAHLRKGTITVRKGGHVRCGEAIGQCGNSGDSPSPQLQLIQLAAVEPAVPVPPVFSLYAAGEAPVRQVVVVVGTPRAGEYVEPREAALYTARPELRESYVPRPWQISGGTAGAARPAPASRPGTANAGPAVYGKPTTLPYTQEHVSGPGSTGPGHPRPGNLRPQPVAPPAQPSTPIATPVVTPVATSPAAPAQPATPIATPVVTPVATSPAAPAQPATPTPTAGSQVSDADAAKEGGKHKGRGADRNHDGIRDADQDNGQDGQHAVTEPDASAPAGKGRKGKHEPEKPPTPETKSPVPETKVVPGAPPVEEPAKPDHSPEKPATPETKSPVPETKEVPGNPSEEKKSGGAKKAEEAGDGSTAGQDDGKTVGTEPATTADDASSSDTSDAKPGKGKGKKAKP